MRTTRHSIACIVILSCCSCLAADDDGFYKRFLSLVNTNDTKFTAITSVLLVDTNNTSPKFTNSVIDLHALRTGGELAGIRLGMTMDEVVSGWGLPRWAYSNCGGSPRLAYVDTRLNFKNNALDMVYLPEAARFSHGLRGNSTMKDWVKVLGEPTIRNGNSLVYETHGTIRTVLLLSFNPDGSMKAPPSLWRDPMLTNWFKTVQP